MQDFPSFVRLVHEVYPRLHDRAFLQNHPLLTLLGGPSPLGAERLHRTLIDALGWLQPLGATSPASVEWRRYRHLQLRYVEGASPEAIARELQVSARQARRDHAQALDELARLLWQCLVRAAPAAPTEPVSSSAIVSPRKPPRPVSARPSDSLDAELSNLAAATTVPVQVAEVIQGVTETVSRLALANGVRIVEETRGPLEPVAVNRTVLRQLLLNVLSEAIVRHPNSTISIRTDAGDRALDVVVAISEVPGPDPGGDDATGLKIGEVSSGISAAVLDLSRRLAQSQGASLRTEPRPGGATVRLSLPAAPARTLLLVDDNPDVSLLFRRFLGETDYQLVQARSAERALRLARELRPEVVFLDVLMPAHDGWEILQALRADPATTTLPVVICSVIPDHALAYSLGVTDFLSKPVTRSALLEVLARLPGAPGRGDRPDPRESIDTARQRADHPVG